VVSSATATVANVNDVPTGGVSITGTVTEDQILTADTSALADDDGLGTFSYTWQRDGVDIGGATASTYTLTDADVGTSITATVDYTDSNGTAESVVTSATAAVANVNDVPTGGVSITGTVTADQTLTADTSALVDNDGLGTFSYTWQRDGVDIGGATASTYTLTDTDVGSIITVTTDYTDANGSTESVVSSATSAVASAISPDSTSGPDETSSTDSTPTENTTEIADSIDPLLAGNMNQVSDDTSYDPTLTQATEEASNPLSEADIVIDIDEKNTPKLLVTQGNGDLLRSLTADQSSSNPINIALIPEAGLTNTNAYPISPATSTINTSGLDSSFMQKGLNELNQLLGTDAQAREIDNSIMVKTAAGASILLSAGFITWALQSSSIATAFALTLPSWNNMDPLAVLDTEALKKHKLKKSEGTDEIDDVFTR